MRQTSLNAAISAIEYHLPREVVTSSGLAAEFPEWPVHKIEEKTGIRERHVVSGGECASDLAMAAAQKLFDSGRCSAAGIDYLLLCTQSPDYFLPTTACVLQDRLGIPLSAGALDFNLGCSGFVYGLGLAKGLIETGQARNVLLITAETYSKFIHPGDKSVRTLFGDAAAATLVSGIEGSGTGLGPFVYGTDGSGAPNLMVATGGMRNPRTPESALAIADQGGNVRSRDNLFMDGAALFNFALRAVPPLVCDLLGRAGITLEEVDLFVFHQANHHMMEHLRKKVGVPREKFVVALENFGNTVSSTIPIALKEGQAQGRVKPGDLIMLVGFGVGYSWGATLARIPHSL